MKMLARVAVGAFLAIAAFTTNATAQSAAADPDSVLGGTRWHPFSACNFALGAGMSYARLAASDQWTGVGNGTGAGTLPLAADGVIGRLGMGCDMHFNRTVLGGYMNYNFGSVGTRVSDVSIDVDRQWGFGVRAGYMLTENWLMYGTLGLQYGHANFTDSTGSLDKSMKGVRFGLGSEYKIAAPMWLRLEADGTRYEKINVGELVTVNPTVYTATASVVFKF